MFLRIGSVKFLNARPLDYGFRNFKVLKEKNQKLKNINISFMEDVPSKLIEFLQEKKIDIGLVSSIETLRNQDILLYYKGLGVCSLKQVYSIFYIKKRDFNEKPVKRIYLDKSSKTSTALLKILYYKKFKELPEFEIDSPQNFINKIDKESAGLIIGDPAIKLYLQQNSFYLKDLSEWWYELTELPFVFALWVYNKKLNFDEEIFEESYQYGMLHINQIIKESEFPLNFTENYLKKVLYYRISEKEKKSLMIFYNYLKELDLL